MDFVVWVTRRLVVAPLIGSIHRLKLVLFLGQPFEHFYFPGNTWSLGQQLTWIDEHLQNLDVDQPRFVFLNVG